MLLPFFFFNFCTGGISVSKIPVSKLYRDAGSTCLYLHHRQSALCKQVFTRFNLHKYFKIFISLGVRVEKP